MMPDRLHFKRELVALREGEVQPKYAHFEPPPGTRLETDQEFRSRIIACLARLAPEQA